MPNSQITPAEFSRLQKRKPTGQKKTTADAITLEKDVALAGVQWLRLNGWMVHRIQADRHAKGGNRKRHEREEPGTPDYIAMAPMLAIHTFRTTAPTSATVPVPRFIFHWEVKRTVGGVISKSQRDWAAAHPDQLVTYAASFEELKQFVKENFPWTTKTK